MTTVDEERAKELIDVPYDQLPKNEISKEDQEYMDKNLDTSKKMTFITNLIQYKDDTSLVFKFDTSLLRKCKKDIQFCHAIKGALLWSNPDEVKKYLLEYIQRDFDPTIQEVYVKSNGRIDEPDICVVLDPKNNRQICWIKFLRHKINDENWKEFQESQAGTNTVIINNTLGRET